MRSVAGSVAIAVGVVRGGAARGEFLAAGRLRELPDGGVRDAACGWGRRTVRDDAAWRGRASVVINEICEVTLAVGRKTFFFRRLLSQKFGFLLLYRGPQTSELKSSSQAGNRGTSDAANAAATEAGVCRPRCFAWLLVEG